MQLTPYILKGAPYCFSIPQERNALKSAGSDQYLLSQRDSSHWPLVRLVRGIGEGPISTRAYRGWLVPMRTRRGVVYSASHRSSQTSLQVLFCRSVFSTVVR